MLLIPASTAIEDVLNRPGSGARKKQYLFIFMCLYTVADLLVGYSYLLNELPSLDFLVGVCSSSHSFDGPDFHKKYEQMVQSCSVIPNRIYHEIYRVSH